VSELTDQIEALVAAEVTKQTGKYKKALQEAIGILQALVGEPEFECDVCGNSFVPIEKVVKTRHAFCSDECASTAYQQAHEGERKHIPLPERVKESLAGQIARSEAQQKRHASEKVSKPVAVAPEPAIKFKPVNTGSAAPVKPLHDCKQCGKPTSKLFCNDDCRKDYEKVFSTKTFMDPWDCEMCRNANSLCQSHEYMTQEGKNPPNFRAYHPAAFDSPL
jgi:hypothetical protein